MKPRPALAPNERNIYRYTHGGATSWAVQVKRAGVPYVEYFADGGDGPWASKRRAKAWLKDLKARITPWNKLHHRTSNPSGISGVTVTNDRTRAGTRVRRWMANWSTANGGRGKRTFSVAKYGERRAKALAIEAREQGVDELLAARSRAER